MSFKSMTASVVVTKVETSTEGFGESFTDISGGHRVSPVEEDTTRDHRGRSSV